MHLTFLLNETILLVSDIQQVPLAFYDSRYRRLYRRPDPHWLILVHMVKSLRQRKDWQIDIIVNIIAFPFLSWRVRILAATVMILNIVYKIDLIAVSKMECSGILVWDASVLLVLVACGVAQSCRVRECCFWAELVLLLHDNSWSKCLSFERLIQESWAVLNWDRLIIVLLFYKVFKSLPILNISERR